MLGRSHKGAMKRKGQFEVSSSMEDTLWEIYKYGIMTVCLEKPEASIALEQQVQSTHYVQL